MASEDFMNAQNFPTPPGVSEASSVGSTHELAMEPPATDEKTIISGASLLPAVEMLRPPSIAEQALVLRGNQLGQYVLDELIGGGGMGAVFRGHDTLLDRTVAVKVVPSSRPDADTLRRFRAEAQSAAKLDHPNIARVYNFGESDEWKYIVFEFVEGINLRDWVQQYGPLSVDDAVFFVRQVAEALEHASSRSIVHRDIKPSNIIVAPDGQVKVVDMGLARTMAFESSHDITASGVTLGTFDYVSPEQARDPRDADVRSDLYSLGCTFYFLLTGRPPFAEGTALQKVFKHTSEPPPNPRAFRDDVSPELAAILFKLMAKRPSDRYQTPRDLVGDLQLLAELEQLPKCRSHLPTLPIVAQWSRRTPWERIRPWLVTLGVGGLISAILHFEPLSSSGYALPSLSPPNSDLPKVPSTGVVFRPDFGESATLSPDSPDSVQAELANADRNPELAGSSPVGDTASTTSSPMTSDRAVLEPMNNPSSNGLDPSEMVRSNLRSDFVETSNSGERLGQEDVATSGTEAFAIDRSGRTVYVDPRTESPWDRSEVPAVFDLISAIEYAVKHSEVQDIVILANEQTIVPGQLARSLTGRLRITAAAGYRPRIRVAPPIEHVGVTGVLHLGSSQVDFQGLDFEWDADQPATVRALFVAQDGAQMRFEQCSFRVTAASSELRPAIIEFERASDPTHPLSAEPIRIRMENLVVRGECDLVRMSEGRRSELSIRNALVSVRGSVLAIGGLASKSRSVPSVRMQLDRVTSVTGASFARINYSAEHPFAVNLIRHASNSVFACSKEVPYIQMLGHPQGAEFRKTVDLRGSDNAYDESIQDWLEVVESSDTSVRLPFETLAEMNPTESSIEGYVRWAQPLPSQLDYANLPVATFRQRPGDFKPGFEENSLP